eukprot:scaffold3297_cov90-Isochrysis_galbana.AAC.3
MTFRSAMRRVPRERQRVMTAGSPSVQRPLPRGVEHRQPDLRQADGPHGQTDDPDGDRQALREGVELGRQRRLLLVLLGLLHPLLDLAYFGTRAGGGDYGGAAAICDDCTCEQHAALRSLVGGEGGGAKADQPAVGGHPIPHPQLDNVAGHQHAGRQVVHPLAAPQALAVVRLKLLQGVQRRLSRGLHRWGEYR